MLCSAGSDGAIAFSENLNPHHVANLQLRKHKESVRGSRWVFSLPATSSTAHTQLIHLDSYTFPPLPNPSLVWIRITHEFSGGHPFRSRRFDVLYPLPINSIPSLSMDVAPAHSSGASESKPSLWKHKTCSKIGLLASLNHHWFSLTLDYLFRRVELFTNNGLRNMGTPSPSK